MKKLLQLAAIFAIFLVLTAQKLSQSGGGDSSVAVSNIFVSTGGFFIPYANITPSAISANKALNITAVANKVFVYQFLVPWQLTITKLTWIDNACTGTCHSSFAIWNTAGTTDIFDSGVFTETAGSLVVTNTIGSTVINPGVYLYAWTSDNTTQTTNSANIFSTSSQDCLINQNASRLGTAANSSTAGAMPGSLGAITPFNTMTPPSTSTGACNSANSFIPVAFVE
jgi:hypothetical protein